MTQLGCSRFLTHFVLNRIKTTCLEHMLFTNMPLEQTPFTVLFLPKTIWNHHSKFSSLEYKHSQTLTHVHLHAIIQVPRLDLQPPTISPLSLNLGASFRWHGSLIFMLWQLHQRKHFPRHQALLCSARCQFVLEWWTPLVENQLQWELVVVSAFCDLPVVVWVK